MGNRPAPSTTPSAAAPDTIARISVTYLLLCWNRFQPKLFDEHLTIIVDIVFRLLADCSPKRGTEGGPGIPFLMLEATKQTGKKCADLQQLSGDRLRRLVTVFHQLPCHHFSHIDGVCSKYCGLYHVQPVRHVRWVSREVGVHKQSGVILLGPLYMSYIVKGKSSICIPFLVLAQLRVSDSPLQLGIQIHHSSVDMYADEEENEGKLAETMHAGSVTQLQAGSPYSPRGNSENQATVSKEAAKAADRNTWFVFEFDKKTEMNNLTDLLRKLHAFSVCLAQQEDAFCSDNASARQASSLSYPHVHHISSVKGGVTTAAAQITHGPEDKGQTNKAKKRWLSLIPRRSTHSNGGATGIVNKLVPRSRGRGEPPIAETTQPEIGPPPLHTRGQVDADGWLMLNKCVNQSVCNTVSGVGAYCCGWKKWHTMQELPTAHTQAEPMLEDDTAYQCTLLRLGNSLPEVYTASKAKAGLLNC